jgi:hypothetical protein
LLTNQRNKRLDIQYYVQNVERGYVGNNLLWWRKGGCGYTCDLGQAEVFDFEDPKFQSLLKNKKFKVWERFYIDLCSSRMVEHQSLVLENSGLKDTDSNEK